MSDTTSILNQIVEQTKSNSQPNALGEAEHMNRLHVVEARAEVMGFALPQVVKPLGSKLIAVGEGTFRAEQADHASKPTLVESMEWLQNTIKAEKRMDVEVKVKDLLMDPETGRLKRKDRLGKPGLRVTERGLGQLLSLMDWAPDSAFRYLRSVPKEWRAEQFNKIVNAGNGRSVTCRIRHPEGDENQPTLFSVVSSRYADCGPLALANVLLGMSRSDPTIREYKADVEYRGDGRSTIRIESLTDLQPSDARVGDIFSGGASIWTSDDKTSPLGGESFLIRILCVNLGRGAARFGAFSTRHVGDPDRLAQAVEHAIKVGVDGVTPFLHVYGDAGRVDALDVIATARRLTAAYEGAKRAEALVSVPGVEQELLLNWMLEAYRMEPEASQRGMYDAITRLVHVGAWSDPLAAREQLAGAATQVLTMAPSAFQALSLPIDMGSN